MKPMFSSFKLRFEMSVTSLEVFSCVLFALLWLFSTVCVHIFEYMYVYENIYMFIYIYMYMYVSSTSAYSRTCLKYLLQYYTRFSFGI